MKDNTKEVKKNFLKKIKMILSTIMLSLMMVPSITSCIQGNTPNKPSTKVEENKPENPTPQVEQNFDDLFTKATDKLLSNVKIDEDKYYHIFDLSLPSSQLISELNKEENRNFFSLGKCKNDGNLYLISTSVLTMHAKFYKSMYSSDPDVSSIGADYKKVFDKTSEPARIDEMDYDFKTLADALEFKWKMLRSGSYSNPFFYPECYPWITKGSFNSPLFKGWEVYGESNILIYVKSVDSEGKVIEPEVYFYNCSSMEKIIDWEITFINKNDKSQIYSFHVGPYSIKNSPGGKLYNFPPRDDANPGNINYAGSIPHMLKLSTLVKIALTPYRDTAIADISKNEALEALKKKYPDETNLSAKVVELVDNYINTNITDKILDNNWDIYLSFESSIVYEKGHITGGYDGIWRNTLKLTGEDANTFWAESQN